MSIRKELINKIICERLELFFKLSEKDFIVPGVEDAIEINRRTMELTGEAFGVRDENLLHSAFEAVYEYAQLKNERNPEVLSFVLFVELIKKNPFLAGNKQTAIVLCELMLRLNGIQKEISNDAYYRMAHAVAKGEIQDPYVLSEMAFRKIALGIKFWKS